MSLHGCHEHFPAELPLQRPQAAAARQHAVPRGGRNSGSQGGGSASSGNDLQRVNEDMHGGQGICYFFGLSLGFGVFSDRGGGTEEEEGTAACLARGGVLEFRIFVKCFISPLQFGGFLTRQCIPPGSFK